MLQVDYILEQKGGNVKDCLTHFLQLWVENEGDEGNRDTIVYTLEGLKMPEVANGVFQWNVCDEIFYSTKHFHF